MVALNFIKQFADDVESGVKQQTFREDGKRPPPKVGDELQLYYGMRTKVCRLLRRAKCISVERLIIYPQLWKVEVPYVALYTMTLYRPYGDVNQLAKDDGFSSVKEFFEYFGKDGKCCVKGYLIKWAVQ